MVTTCGRARPALLIISALPHLTRAAVCSNWKSSSDCERNNDSGCDCVWNNDACSKGDVCAGIGITSVVEPGQTTTTTKRPAGCCRAYTAECLACVDQISVKEYCSKKPDVVGCPKDADFDKCSEHNGDAAKCLPLRTCVWNEEKQVCYSSGGDECFAKAGQDERKCKALVAGGDCAWSASRKSCFTVGEKKEDKGDKKDGCYMRAGTDAAKCKPLVALGKCVWEGSKCHLPVDDGDDRDSDEKKENKDKCYAHAGQNAAKCKPLVKSGRCSWNIKKKACIMPEKAAWSMQAIYGLGLCTGPSSDFNSGADLPSTFSLDNSVVGYRSCSGGFKNVETCKTTCLGLAACRSMSHNGYCCFLYQATNCPQSSHADTSSYTTYFKKAFEKADNKDVCREKGQNEARCKYLAKTESCVWHSDRKVCYMSKKPTTKDICSAKAGRSERKCKALAKTNNCAWSSGKKTCYMRPTSLAKRPDPCYSHAGQNEAKCKQLMKMKRTCAWSAVSKKCHQPKLNTKSALSRDEVSLQLRVKNLVYAKLVANPKVLDKFKTTTKAAIARSARGNIRPQNVELKLSAGSVIVDAIITPPVGASAKAVSSMLNKVPNMDSIMAAEISKVQDISQVSNGVIGVELSKSPTVQSVEAAWSMQAQSGLGLCTGPSSDFNSGADLPSGFSIDNDVVGYRSCSSGFNIVETCKTACLSLAACSSMSHNGKCCFLYQATTCPQSSHAATSQYTTYFKKVDDDDDDDHDDDDDNIVVIIVAAAAGVVIAALACLSAYLFFRMRKAERKAKPVGSGTQPNAAAMGNKTCNAADDENPTFNPVVAPETLGTIGGGATVVGIPVGEPSSPGNGKGKIAS